MRAYTIYFVPQFEGSLNENYYVFWMVQVIPTTLNYSHICQPFDKMGLN
jgi:hypothetical protein